MNEIKVRKRESWYYIFVDNKLADAFVSVQAVVDWLELNFSPPIKVRWFVENQKGTVK